MTKLTKILNSETQETLFLLNLFKFGYNHDIKLLKNNIIYSSLIFHKHFKYELSEWRRIYHKKNYIRKKQHYNITT
jgi:hypothetical protein